MARFLKHGRSEWYTAEQWQRAYPCHKDGCKAETTHSFCPYSTKDPRPLYFCREHMREYKRSYLKWKA